MKTTQTVLPISELSFILIPRPKIQYSAVHTNKDSKRAEIAFPCKKYFECVVYISIAFIPLAEQKAIILKCNALCNGSIPRLRHTSVALSLLHSSMYIDEFGKATARGVPMRSSTVIYQAVAVYTFQIRHNRIWVKHDIEWRSTSYHFFPLYWFCYCQFSVYVLVMPELLRPSLCV